MKKRFNTISFILIIFCFLNLNSFTVNALTVDTDNSSVHLILDSSHYNELPQNFRTTSNLSSFKNKNLNLSGLDKLNISGSHQFSQYNLPMVIKNIHTSFPITIVDLRQESHGFVNGLPVSFANAKNNANEGLTKKQVIEKENSDLSSIKLNEQIYFYNHPKTPIVPTKVENESTLVTSNSLSYIRIPVTDTQLPLDDMVDYFVEIVKSKPENSWFHFHCKHGVGRTTTFMTMYDIMKNFDKASLNDIVQRQLILGNFTKTLNPVFDENALKFLQTFYNYTQSTKGKFNIKYSEWKKTMATSHSLFSFKIISSTTDTSWCIT